MSRYCQGFLLISLDSLSFPSPLSFYISSTRFFRILAGSWYSCTRCKSGFRFAFVFLFLIYLRKWFEEKQIGFVFFLNYYFFGSGFGFFFSQRGCLSDSTKKKKTKRTTCRIFMEDILDVTDSHTNRRWYFPIICLYLNI